MGSTFTKPERSIADIIEGGLFVGLSVGCVSSLSVLLLYPPAWPVIPVAEAMALGAYTVSQFVPEQNFYSTFLAQYAEENGFEVEGEIYGGHFAGVVVFRRGEERFAFKFPAPYETRYWDGEEMMPIDYGTKVGNVRHAADALERAKGIDGVAQLVDRIEIIAPEVYQRKFEKKGTAGDAWATYACRYDTKAEAYLQEYIPGNRLSKGKIQGEENTAVIKQALQCCHERGIVGVDLDRKDIIVTQTGKPYLIDFGGTRLYDNVAEIPEDMITDDIHYLEWLLE